MFENYEQEEPKENKLAIFIPISVLLLPLIFFGAFQFLPGMRNDPPQTNHTIQTDETQLRRVDELCTSLPKPEKFEFIARTESASFNSSTVTYAYRSTRGAEEIMPAFLLWFNENGWNSIPNTSTFEKANQTIYISIANFENTFSEYYIYCTEKK